MSESQLIRLYYRNGQVRLEQPQVGGRIDGVQRTWHRNGILASEQPHDRGLMHGVCRQWDERSRLLGSFEMLHGTGIQRQWHTNTQLQSETATHGGDLHGRTRLWLRDGTLIHEQHFIRNREVTFQDYRDALPDDSELPRYADTHPAEVFPDGPELELRKHVLFVQSILEHGQRCELLEWISRGEALGKTVHLGPVTDTQELASFARVLYQAGANTVTAIGVYSNAAGDEFSDWLLVDSTTKTARRRHIRELLANQLPRDGGIINPSTDLGEKEMILVYP